jgi:RHH-type transcriptional regulator, proline utilization regulon repressor / proline dehydrogenase / delta 1-pyrroline-5-carboxylate dehydrogenase
VARLRAAGADIFTLPLPAACAHGTYFPPTLIEIPDVAALAQEVFGPVLHVVRFRQDQLGALLAAINATGYGLTHGIQTRIDETVEAICTRVRAGNIYVNRNIVGAVVGVQPFGGEGLSGTGPKAGGPHYLWRLVRETPMPPRPDAISGVPLPGPTGETNMLYLRPRGRVACVADTGDALFAQAQAAIAEGNVAVLGDTTIARDVCRRIEGPCELVPDPITAAPDAVLFAGAPETARALRRRLAAMDGPLVPLINARDGRYDEMRLTCERTVTINTTASGGNASLLSLSETPG